MFLLVQILYGCDCRSTRKRLLLSSKNIAKKIFAYPLLLLRKISIASLIGGYHECLNLSNDNTSKFKNCLLSFYGNWREFLVSDLFQWYTTCGCSVVISKFGGLTSPVSRTDVVWAEEGLQLSSGLRARWWPYLSVTSFRAEAGPEADLAANRYLVRGCDVDKVFLCCC